MFQRMFNASLEKVRTQCNSIGFTFKPRSFTKVNFELVPFLLEQVKNKGIFLVPDDIEEGSPAFAKREREALLNYLGITLRERIINYMAMQDDYRRKGVELLPDKRFKRAVRWEEELRKELEAFAPIEEELSFLDLKRIKDTQLPEKEEDRELSFVTAVDSKPESTIAATVTIDAPIATAKKRGRPFSKGASA